MQSGNKLGLWNEEKWSCYAFVLEKAPLKSWVSEPLFMEAQPGCECCLGFPKNSLASGAFMLAHSVVRMSCPVPFLWTQTDNKESGVYVQDQGRHWHTLLWGWSGDTIVKQDLCSSRGELNAGSLAIKQSLACLSQLLTETLREQKRYIWLQLHITCSIETPLLMVNRITNSWV